MMYADCPAVSCVTKTRTKAIWPPMAPRYICQKYLYIHMLRAIFRNKVPRDRQRKRRVSLESRVFDVTSVFESLLDSTIRAGHSLISIIRLAGIGAENSDCWAQKFFKIFTC